MKKISALILQLALQSQLPRYKRIALGYEPTYYGASSLIAKKARLSTYIPARCYVWSHGCSLLGPQDIRYYIRFPELKGNVLVATENEKDFLVRERVSNVHAIGLPICYTESERAKREPGSLLAMLPHSTLHSSSMLSFKPYLDFIQNLTRRFRRVVCCVSRQCLRDKALVEQCFQRGLPLVWGAAIDDANSLQRTRELFERFEYVTTNSFGSHLAYAMAFGCKTSVAGPLFELKSVDYANEPFYQEHPDLIDPHYLDNRLSALKRVFGSLFVAPSEAALNVDWGRSLIGAQNVKPPADVAELLGLK